MKQKVTPDFETFDLISFDKIEKSASSWGDVSKTLFKSRERNIKKEFLNTGGQFIMREKNSDDSLKKETYKTNASIVENEYLDIFFTFSKQYYLDGKIRSKGIGSWLGFDIGKVYLFNENGKIIEIKDSDLGYAYDYDKVFIFCQENGISLKKSNGGPKLTIKKGIWINDNKPSWFIESPDFEMSIYKTFVIDGMTGKLKDKGEKPFIKDGF